MHFKHQTQWVPRSSLFPVSKRVTNLPNSKCTSSSRSYFYCFLSEWYTSMIFLQYVTPLQNSIKPNAPIVLVANGFHVVTITERKICKPHFLSFLKLGHRADR